MKNGGVWRGEACVGEEGGGEGCGEKEGARDGGSWSKK